MLSWRQLALALVAMTLIAVLGSAVLTMLAGPDREALPTPTAAEQLERSSPVWRGIGSYGGRPAEDHRAAPPAAE